MHYWRKKPQTMVGYARVSTNRQEAQGYSLQSQCHQQTTYASQNCFTLPEIYADTASASKKRSYLRRGDLRDAVTRAKEMRCPILVVRLDRLSRDIDDLQFIEQSGVEIFSIEDGGRATKKTLRKAIREAQKVAKRLSLAASEDWKSNKRSATGKPLSSLSQSDRKFGTLQNKLRADRKINEVADFLMNNGLVSLGVPVDYRSTSTKLDCSTWSAKSITCGALGPKTLCTKSCMKREPFWLSEKNSIRTKLRRARSASISP